MLLFVVVLAPTTENQFEQPINYGSGGFGGWGGQNLPQLWNLLMATCIFMYSQYYDRKERICYEYVRLITRVNVRYGEIFHEPKASEISRHISQLTSVISALFL